VFLLRLALRPWKLSPLSQIFSALAVGVLLLLGGFLTWMQSGLGPVLARLESEQVVTAYLDPSVEAKDEGRVVDSIRTALGAQASGVDIRFVTPEQFVGHLKGPYPELGRELEDLGSEMSAVVPRYVSVSGLLGEQSLRRIKGVQGIESAESSKDRYAPVLGAFKALRWVARLFVAGLAFALLIGLIHLARTNSYLHREAHAILKQWGADELLVRLPGMLSAMLVGLGGGVIALIGWLTAGAWLVRQLHGLSPMLVSLPQPSATFAVALLLSGLLVGMFAGAVGERG
jgi:cell division protein FtsX